MQKQRSVICPNCETEVSVTVMCRLGHKKLNIGVKNICDALRVCRDITLAAEKLGRSRAYIYQQLGKRVMRPKEIVQGK